MQVGKTVTTNRLQVRESRLQHHFQGGQTRHVQGRAAGQLTGSAVVTASTLKVCCSMKEEISNPQHCVGEGPSAHMVSRGRTCACAGTERQSWTLSKCPKSGAASLSLDSPSPLCLSSPTPPPTPPSPTLCLCAHPLLFLCSSSHTCVISIPPTLPWAETRSAWPERGGPLPIKKRTPTHETGAELNVFNVLPSSVIVSSARLENVGGGGQTQEEIG